MARVLEFTGALGSLFYYIPTVPQVNGIIVGTPTQINDNTTTSILLDFSDNTLFAGLSLTCQPDGSDVAVDVISCSLPEGSRVKMYGISEIVAKSIT